MSQTVTLYYQSTAWGTGFSIDEPTCSGTNNEEGFFEPGEYWQRNYHVPSGFILKESEDGIVGFYRGDDYFSLSHEGTTPLLVNGHEEIYFVEVK